MFQILDGRTSFWQWDLGQRLVVADDVCNQVHFCNRTDDCSLVCEVYEENGQRLVDVPNILLQTAATITVFAYVHTANEGRTKHSKQFIVLPRSKPADYIYTETEVLTVEQAVEDALQAAKESGDFKGEQGEQGVQGERGERGEQGSQGESGLHGDTPCVAMRYDKDTGDLAYCVTYATERNEPDKTAVEVWDNTKADFLPDDYPPMLTDGTGEYEGMLVYSVNSSHIPAGMTRKLINLKILRNINKAVLRLKIKYLSVALPDGTEVKPKLFVSDVWETPNVFGADYAVTDEDGNPVGNPMAGLELNKWYVVYITANGDADFQMWAVWQHIEELMIEAVIKDVELLHHEAMPAYLQSNSGNCAPMSLYKTAGGGWQYVYSSFAETGSTMNTAYYRRLSMLLDAADYHEARFDFMYTKSDFKSETNCNLYADVPITVIDASGNVVANADRRLNTWYTAILKKADGSTLPKKFDLYPQGYADGTASGMLNIEMQIKNCRAYKRILNIKEMLA